jgi:protein O-mannosyl-transferase
LTHLNKASETLGRSTLLFGSALLTYVIYSLAFGAPWFFDDANNLGGLAQVVDAATAWPFVFGGIASVTGRPVSNLSFLLNVADWPANPGGFRYTTTMFHILNGMVLAWAALRMARLVPALQRRAELFAVLLASAWLLHPLLFSTMLMPVQRMTVLAGTFTLIGLLLYIVGRARMTGPFWRSGIVLCSLGVGGGSVVGLLAKESAILLPMLVGVVEFTLFRKLPISAPRPIWVAWKGIFLLLPVIVLAGYLATHLINSSAAYDSRSFGLNERIGAQAIILWEYLRQVWIPSIAALGPFQDDSIGRPLTSIGAIVGLIAWLVLVLTALVLKTKGVFVLAAILWFLVGHILESSVLPLELYFEHRNYIPAIGPLALIIGAGVAIRSLRWLPWLATSVFAVLLWSTASLWANSWEASEVQLSYHPKSVRAASFAASEYMKQGQPDIALSIIESTLGRVPEATTLHISRLQLACALGEKDSVRISVEKILEQSPDLDVGLGVSDSLKNILDLTRNDSCYGLDLDIFEQVVGALMHSQRIASSNLMMHHLHHIMAEVLELKGETGHATEHLRRAFYAQKNPETALLASAAMASQGRHEEAVIFLDQALLELPWRARISSYDWRKQADVLRGMICQLASSDFQGCRGIQVLPDQTSP